MSIFINQPTLPIDFLAPKSFRYDVVGGGIDGGRDGTGHAGAIEFSGGGRLVAEFADCNIFKPEQHEWVNRVAARMNGSFRLMNVPIMSDWMGPFPTSELGVPQPFVSGIPHSDGSLFTDGAGYSQATVFGIFAADAANYAGQITVNVYGAERNLRASDWFSVYHSTKGWRAYRYWEASDPEGVTETVEGEEYTGKQYVLSISPPLRAAVSAGTRIEFARPRFVARFPIGFTLPYTAEGFYISRPTMKFVEA